MLIDPTHVVATAAEVNELPEYSCTLPSGTTVGKRWRRSEFFGDRRYPGRWFMGEYEESSKPGHVDIRWREILVVEV